MRGHVPPWTDLGLALALVAVTQAELWVVRPEGVLPVMSAGLAIGCLAVAFRRVAPWAATAVVLAGLMVVPALAEVDAALTLGWLLVALGTCASLGFHGHRPWWGLALVLGLSAAAVMLEHGPVPAEVLFAWILAGGAWLGGRGVAAQAAATRLARERAALVEEHARVEAAAAVTDERLRIAREMHDVVAHSISVMTLHVSGVRRLLTADQSTEREALLGAEKAAREAMAEMHNILGVLRSEPHDSADDAPLLARLEEVVELTRAAGVEVRFERPDDLGELPVGVDLAAYRIVQESLTNVRRHARATRVDLCVERRPDGLVIEVRDDGVGLDTDTGPGHGLVGMSERAAAYCGKVSVEDAEDSGVVVRVWLPLTDTAVRR